MGYFIQIIIHFIVCMKLISTQNESSGLSVTFRLVRVNATIVGHEPFYNQTTYSTTECHLACLRQLEICSFVKIGSDTNSVISCQLFNIIPKDIGKHLKSLPGVMKSTISTPELPQDCLELKKRFGIKQDGVYFIRSKNNVTGAMNKKVYCDMTTDGGGWIVIQKRFDGSVDFYRNWSDYKNGFGDVYGEFWLGNEFVHQYTEANPNAEMLVEAFAFDGTKASVKLHNFKLGDEVAFKYSLHYDQCVVIASEDQKQICADWARAQGMRFTTRDRDNDIYGTLNCAIRYPAGWWFDGCFGVNLNGVYSKKIKVEQAMGINLNSFRGYFDSMKETKMLIRRARN